MEVYKKRRGKTLTFSWTITKNGEAVDLDASALTLYRKFHTGYAEPVYTKITDFSVVEGSDGVSNVVQWTWEGSETTSEECGLYSFALFENEGEDSQTVVDSSDMIELVPSTNFEGES